MDSTLFEEWVRELDVKFQKENRKNALIIDNCPAHKKAYPKNPKNLYSYPQTSPWPPSILKNNYFKITLKKYSYKSENTLTISLTLKNN